MRAEAEDCSKKAAQDLEAERESRSNAEKSLLKLKSELESLQSESEASRRNADQQLVQLQAQILQIKERQDAAKQQAAAAAPPPPPPPPSPSPAPPAAAAAAAPSEGTKGFGSKPKATRKASSKASSPEGGSVKMIKEEGPASTGEEEEPIAKIPKPRSSRKASSALTPPSTTGQEASN